MKKTILHIVLICSLLPLVTLLGQEAGDYLQKLRSANIAVGYQYWKAGPDQVQQVALPFTFVYSVNDKLRMDITTTPSFNTLVTNSTNTLDGPSDTRIRGSYLLEEQSILITGGVNLPSGKSALTLEEFNVATVLANHAFNFKSPLLGQGTDVNLGVVMSRDLSPVIVGFGLGFLMRGGYQPFSDYDYNYVPGNEFTLSVGADYYAGQENKLYFDLSYTLFGADFANSTRVFKSGNRLSLQAMAVLERNPLSFVFSIADRIQGKNQTGSGELAPERLNSNGNELDVTALALLPYNSVTSLRGIVNARLYSNNAYDVGGATLVGFGAGLTRGLTNWINLDAEARYYFGSLQYTSGGIGLSGVQLSGGVKVYF